MKKGPVSCFDAQNCEKIKRLWKPVSRGFLRDVTIDISNKFWKVTKRFGKGKQRYYFIDEEYLYASRTQNIDAAYGFVSLYGARVDFLTESNGECVNPFIEEPIYGFRVFRNQRQVEFFTEDLEIFDEWKAVFRRRALLGSFYDDFKMDKFIGKGSFARVYLATKKETGEQFAVKVFTKEIIATQVKGVESILNEISIMRTIDHQSAIMLYEAHETDNSLFFVLDIISGGDLYKHIKAKQSMPLIEIQLLMFNMLKLLAYLAKKRIIHRDIKPENVLLRNSTTPFDVVLADFGLATKETGKKLFQRCGSPGFVAPEILMYKDTEPFYGPKADVFSAGVVLYMLLTGEHAFNGKGGKAILQQNRDAIIDYTALKKKIRSTSAISMLKGMLEPNPKIRMSAEQCLEHPFLVEEGDDTIIDLQHVAQSQIEYETQLQTLGSAISDSLLLTRRGSTVIVGDMGTSDDNDSQGFDGSLIATYRKAYTSSPKSPSYKSRSSTDSVDSQQNEDTYCANNFASIVAQRNNIQRKGVHDVSTDSETLSVD